MSAVFFWETPRPIVLFISHTSPSWIIYKIICLFKDHHVSYISTNTGISKEVETSGARLEELRVLSLKVCVCFQKSRFVLLYPLRVRYEYQRSPDTLLLPSLSPYSDMPDLYVGSISWFFILVNLFPLSPNCKSLNPSSQFTDSRQRHTVCSKNWTRSAPSCILSANVRSLLFDARNGKDAFYTQSLSWYNACSRLTEFPKQTVPW